MKSGRHLTNFLLLSSTQYIADPDLRPFDIENLRYLVRPGRRLAEIRVGQVVGFLISYYPSDRGENIVFQKLAKTMLACKSATYFLFQFSE